MMTSYCEVAVPLPVADGLTYRVPESFAGLIQPGTRVRVQVGRRRLIGVVVARRERSPEGVTVRPLLAVLDDEPVLTAELLQLAREVAAYYLAPIGEVIRALLPVELPLWGDQKIWLSNAGAFAAGRTSEEQTVLQILRQSGRLRASDLLRSVGGSTLPTTIDTLRKDGRVVVSEEHPRTTRYRAAVELGPGSIATLRERCGRSSKGRQVVELLAALERPATVSEICETVGCSPAVVRRLVSLGVIRAFTQVETLDLGRHLLQAERPARIRLRADQVKALAALEAALGTQRFAAFLLSGMTGSGKTEVYLRLIEPVLDAGGSAIILVPEIALVPAIAGSAFDRFGRQTAIFHSGLSSRERSQEWERIRGGEARLVLGPRSAVFAPVSNLRLVVVDEEQDASYKQDQVPRYHGRDVAILRAHLNDALAVLVSATPSLESRHNVEIGKLARVRLSQRVGRGELPEGVLVDLRGERTVRRPGEIHFSDRLREEMARALGDGDQIILLRNRRGYAPLLLCRACGESFSCAACGLPRTYHRREGRLRCHYCGSAIAVPRTCPSCSAEALEALGSGTERVEESVAELFPGSSIAVLDRDAARRGEAAAVLERFGRGASQILVGTQMVSKGHHFPRVALTAVLLADTYLGFPDFRAVEKTYTLLTQLAGRAGRGHRPGRVIIQTFHPDHYAIQAALRHDDARFAEEELRFRRIFHYPPYTRMVQLLLRDTNRRRGADRMEQLTRRLVEHPLAREVRFSGPAAAPFEKLRGKWRFQLLLRHRSGQRLRDLLAQVLPARAHADLVIDVDPHELL